MVTGMSGQIGLPVTSRVGVDLVGAEGVVSSPCLAATTAQDPQKKHKIATPSPVPVSCQFPRYLHFSRPPTSSL